MENQKKNKGLIFALIIFVILTFILGGYILYHELNTSKEKTSTNTNKYKQSNVSNKTDKKNTKEEKSEEGINKRLYSLDSGPHKQRYYLLLDDATYDMNQNFLNKKTYILDLNMVNGNKLVREVDLSGVFTPIANQYIASHKGNARGVCSVSYSGVDSQVPPPIDYEKEVAFSAYYRCVENNVESSIGNVIYAYNVETNTIRDLSSGY